MEGVMITDILPEISDKESWKPFIDDGKKFQKTAIGGLKRREVFSSEILYNIFSMAIEKYFMGYFIYNKTMPDNHTFQDFATAAQRLTHVDQGLLDDLDFMGSFQEICSMDFYERKEPSEKDIKIIEQICDRVRTFVMSRIPEN